MESHLSMRSWTEVTKQYAKASKKSQQVGFTGTVRNNARVHILGALRSGVEEVP